MPPYRRPPQSIRQVEAVRQLEVLVAAEVVKDAGTKPGRALMSRARGKATGTVTALVRDTTNAAGADIPTVDRADSDCLRFLADGYKGAVEVVVVTAVGVDVAERMPASRSTTERLGIAVKQRHTTTAKVQQVLQQPPVSLVPSANKRP